MLYLSGPAITFSHQSAIRLTARETLTRMMHQFPGRWNWEMAADDPTAPPLSNKATVKLNAKKVFEIQSAYDSNGTATALATWKPDPAAGTFDLSVGRERFPLRFVYAKEEKGLCTAEFRGENSLLVEDLNVEFSPKRFFFLIKIVPKPGSPVKKATTATFRFTRI